MENASKLAIFSLLLQPLLGCSSMLDKDRGYTEPVTGAVIIARDLLINDDPPASCDSQPKSKQASCNKEVQALAESIEKHKNRE